MRETESEWKSERGREMQRSEETNKYREAEEGEGLKKGRKEKQH